MKVLYDVVKQRILTSTSIMDVRRYNNQLNNLDNETMFLPTILIEFTDVQYGFKSPKVQHGTCLMKVYVVTEQYANDNGDDINFSIWENVESALNRYTDGTNFHPLLRETEEHDSNHSNIYVYTINYRMNFVDFLPTGTPKQYISLDLDVTKTA